MEKLAIEGVGVFVLIVFSLAFVTTFDIVNLSSFFFPVKPFSSVELAILHNSMAFSILSAITTRSVKCYVELLTKYSK
jgi:hypothetical protein